MIVGLRLIIAEHEGRCDLLCITMGSDINVSLAMRCDAIGRGDA